ncbi:hypothetical protein BCR32DRAFT_288491, partial [Anaeromyces robustus]
MVRTSRVRNLSIPKIHIFIIFILAINFTKQNYSDWLNFGLRVYFEFIVKDIYLYKNIKTNKPVNTELLNNNNYSSLNRRDKKTYKTSLKRKHSLVESDSSLGNENNTIQHKRINTNTCPTNNIPLKRRNENLDNGENKKLKHSPIEKVKRPS